MSMKVQHRKFCTESPRALSSRSGGKDAEWEWSEVSWVKWVKWVKWDQLRGYWVEGDELCEWSCVRWMEWDESCKMSCVRWVEWDELRLAEWEKLSGDWARKSWVRWVVWDKFAWVKLCAMTCVGWVVWDEVCEMSLCQSSCVRSVEYVCEWSCVR